MKGDERRESAENQGEKSIELLHLISPLFDTADSLSYVIDRSKEGGKIKNLFQLFVTLCDIVKSWGTTCLIEHFLLG